MKKITLLLCALAMSVAGYSQYYYLDWDLGQNPGGLNTDSEFPRGGGLDAAWKLEMTGPVSDWSGDINLPFTFNFNGTDYTTCKVTAGMLTFGSPSSFPGTTPEALPSSKIPDNTVCIWGLTVGSGDFIVSKTFGSSPNRQFWVQMNTAGNTGVKGGWAYWSIVLEEGSNNIYLVDQRHQCIDGQSVCDGKALVSAGIQIDGSTAYAVDGSPAVESRSGNNSSPADNVYYTFTPGNQATEDILMVGSNMKGHYELPAGDIEITGVIRNIGSNDLTSFDLNYSVDGGATVTENVTGISVKNRALYTFTHKTKFTPPSSSTSYNVRIWTSNPNGGTDADPTNNEIEVDFEVHDKIYVRKPLYEIFTSSTCGPCTPGNANFHNIVDGKEDECVYIKYQQSWPSTGDPYCTAESNARRNYYSINSIPRMEIDGGWDGNAQSFTAEMHTDAIEEPSFMDIQATTIMWGKHVEVDIDIEAAEEFSGNNTLHVAIMEKTTYDNEKTNGETEFLQVMKKMMTGSGVNLGSIKKGDKINRSYTWNFKGDYRLPFDGTQSSWINHGTEHSVEDFRDLMVAIWIQNADSKEVFQAAYATQVNASVIDVAKESKFTVFPNPATDKANIQFELTDASNVNVTILSTSGQELNNTNAGKLNAGNNVVDVDLSNLASGIYYVQLRTDYGSFTKPVTVK